MGALAGKFIRSFFPFSMRCTEHWDHIPPGFPNYIIPKYV